MKLHDFVHAATGYAPPAELSTGIVRFGKKQSLWLRTFEDGGAVFGDWRTSERWTYRPEGVPVTTQKRRQELKVAIELEALAKAESARTSSARAAALYARARVPDTDHPYLASKGIQALGDARQLGSSLLVPMFDRLGELLNTQTILINGRKRFFSGAPVKGLFCPLAGRMGDGLMVCEGYATGCSLANHMGVPVFVAFSASNLVSVAQTVRDLFPKEEIVIAADDDHLSEPNVGLIAASRAARAVGGVAVSPNFPEPRQSHWTDWNDYFQAVGDQR